MITSTLSDRTTSAFLLSIGTSLSFESVFKGTNAPYDPDRPIPNKIDINNYDEIWINLFTLFRNIVSSVPSSSVSKLMPDDIAYVLAEEVELIQDVVKMQTSDSVRVVFYTSSYQNLKSNFKHAKLRDDNTEKQKQMTDLLKESIGIFYKMHALSKTFRHYKLYIKDNDTSNKKILLLSNYAFDLLSHKNFSKMDLLESHTGVLKERSKWHTKYLDGKNMPRLPFNECFLQVFGDSQTFHPMDKVLRKDILDLAEKSNWNPLTTNERIRFTIGNLKNPYFVSILREML